MLLKPGLSFLSTVRLGLLFLLFADILLDLKSLVFTLLGHFFIISSLTVIVSMERSSQY
jgi:hypothetical protein